jgi:hypothetical protein
MMGAVTKRGKQGYERRQCLGRGAEQAVEGADRHHGGGQHGADADRVDVVEMRALELHLLRAQPERLVDDEIGDQRADPCNRNVRVQRQRLLQRLVDADFHQQQRDQHIEHQPDDAAGMAVGEAREEVRPGDRARIGVGDVDLELRQDHEGSCQSERQIRLRQHIAKRFEIHMRGLGGVLGRNAVGQCEIGEERAGQQLDRADNDPARARAQQRHPPARTRAAAVARQEAQEVDLFADLRDQREYDRSGRAKQQEIEMTGGAAVVARKFGPGHEGVAAGIGDGRERQQVEHQPDRLGPELKTADQRDAMGHQRDDDHGRYQVADGARNIETHLQRRGENDRLDGEEDEGERRINQRGNSRADIAETGTAGEEIDINAAFCGIIRDRQSAAEDDDADHQDRCRGVGHAVIDGDGAADGLEGEKRNGAQCRVGDPRGGPAPGALRRKAECVILQGLVGDPLIVLASHAVDTLPPCHYSAPDPVKLRMFA